MRVCPYCYEGAGGIKSGDEYLDYCHECDKLIEGATLDVEELVERVAKLEAICNKAAGAIITKKYNVALAAVIGGVPEEIKDTEEVET